MSESLYRTPKDITALLEMTIDSCLAIMTDSISDDEQKILDKLSEWKLKLAPQLMHVFEAPLDVSDFKDLLRQSIKPVIDSIVEEAKSDGVISDKEQRLIDVIVEKLKI